MQSKVYRLYLLFFCFCFLVNSPIVAEANYISITTAWDANTESHLAGYKVYVKESSVPTKDDYERAFVIPLSALPDISNPQFVINDIDDTQGIDTYSTVTAYGTGGEESAMSNFIVWHGTSPLPTIASATDVQVTFSLEVVEKPFFKDTTADFWEDVAEDFWEEFKP